MQGGRERELASSWSLVHFVVCVVDRQRENCWKVFRKEVSFTKRQSICVLMQLNLFTLQSLHFPVKEH
jgi:hypothetical protein